MEKYIKNALYGLLGIVLYFILYKIEVLPFYLLDINLSAVPTYVKVIYISIYEIMMIAVMMMIYLKTIEKDFYDIKKNHKKYYSKYFKYYLISFGVMLISNLVIMLLFNQDMATNEVIIRESFKISPLYIYFSGIIFAPIVEELVFRGALKRIIPNKYLFVIFSGLLFGFIHVSDNLNTLNDLLYIIPYSSIGIAFAYVYYKTDNIFTSIGLHFMHNGVLLSLQFLTLFL